LEPSTYSTASAASQETVGTIMSMPRAPRQPGHDPNPLRVLLTQRLVPKARRSEPAERFRLSFSGGLWIELVVQVASVDRELQVPRRQEDGGCAQTKYEGAECDTAQQL
jgi:hypothetical protein